MPPRIDGNNEGPSTSPLDVFDFPGSEQTPDQGFHSQVKNPEYLRQLYNEMELINMGYQNGVYEVGLDQNGDGDVDFGPDGPIKFRVWVEPKETLETPWGEIFSYGSRLFAKEDLKINPDAVPRIKPEPIHENTETEIIRRDFLLLSKHWDPNNAHHFAPGAALVYDGFDGEEHLARVLFKEKNFSFKIRFDSENKKDIVTTPWGEVFEFDRLHRIDPLSDDSFQRRCLTYGLTIYGDKQYPLLLVLEVLHRLENNTPYCLEGAYQAHGQAFSPERNYGEMICSEYFLSPVFPKNYPQLLVWETIYRLAYQESLCLEEKQSTRLPQNQPPSVSITGTHEIIEGREITLHADVQDPENHPLNMTWELPETEVTKIGDKNSNELKFSTPLVGKKRTITVKVSVSDTPDQFYMIPGHVHSEHTITILPKPKPKLRPQITPGPQVTPGPGLPQNPSVESGAVSQGKTETVTTKQDLKKNIIDLLHVDDPKKYFEIVFLLDTSGSRTEDIETVKEISLNIVQKASETVTGDGGTGFSVWRYGDDQIKRLTPPLPTEAEMESHNNDAQKQQSLIAGLDLAIARTKKKENKTGSEYTWDASLMVLEEENFTPSNQNTNKKLIVITDVEALIFPESDRNKTINDVLRSATHKGVSFEVIRRANMSPAEALNKLKSEASDEHDFKTAFMCLAILDPDSLFSNLPDFYKQTWGEGAIDESFKRLLETGYMSFLRLRDGLTQSLKKRKSFKESKAIVSLIAKYGDDESAQILLQESKQQWVGTAAPEVHRDYKVHIAKVLGERGRRTDVEALIQMGEPPQLTVHLAIMESLGKIKSREAIPYFEKVKDYRWGGNDESTNQHRNKWAWALGEIGGETARVLLEELGSQPQRVEVYEEIFKALAKIKNPASLELFKKTKDTYWDNAPGITSRFKKSWVWALGEIGSDGARRLIEDNWKVTETYDVHIEIMKALAKLKNQKSLPHFAQNKNVHWDDEDLTNEYKAQWALSLGEIGGSEAKALLDEMAKTPQVLIVHKALLDAQAKIKDQSTKYFVDSSDVRWENDTQTTYKYRAEWAKALGQKGGEESRILLEKEGVKPQSLAVHVAIIEALIKIKNQKSIDYFVKIKDYSWDNDQETSQFRAKWAWGLGKIGGDTARLLLENNWRTTEYVPTHVAFMEALAKIGDKRSVGAFSERANISVKGNSALTDQYRISWLLSLGEIGGEESRLEIEKTGKAPTSLEVHCAVLEALANIGNKKSLTFLEETKSYHWENNEQVTAKYQETWKWAQKIVSNTHAHEAFQIAKKSTENRETAILYAADVVDSYSLDAFKLAYHKGGRNWGLKWAAKVGNEFSSKAFKEAYDTSNKEDVIRASTAVNDQQSLDEFRKNYLKK